MRMQVFFTLALFVLTACQSGSESGGGESKSLNPQEIGDAAKMPNQCDIDQLAIDPQTTLAICEQAAKAGNVMAQIQLGAIYAQGYLGEPDWHQAMRWLLLAADQGHAEAQYVVARNYRLGRGAEKNTREALHWYTQAITQNHPQAQFEVAQLILHGEWPASYDPILLLTLAADKSNSSAQLELAKLYYAGEKVPRNEKLAFQWYLRAANEEPQAQYQVGLAYIYGAFDQEKNIELGSQYLKHAALADYYPAQYALASIYLEGHQVLENRSQAIEYLRQAATSGYVDAQIKLAKVLMEFSLPEYDKVAFHWMNKAAEKGNPDAIYLLGTFYHQGVGTHIDYPRAFELYSLMADQHHHLAELALGQMLFYGHGVEKNPEIARKYFLRSAKGGVPAAKKWVALLFKENNDTAEVDEDDLKDYLAYGEENGEPGALYLKGKNLLFGKSNYAQDISRGIELIHTAANKQHIPAQRELGMLYEQDLFGLQDENKAYQWYQLASENGDDYSQFRLAKMYYLGAGTHKDIIQSFAWAHVAAQQGQEEALALKQEIAELLSGQELSQAQALSEKYSHLYKK